MKKINISGGLLIIFIQNSVILSQSYDFQFHHPQLNEHQFSQQQKQVEASVENYNRHQIQNLKSELLSVHHADSGPQFDFAVNQNYSDLEKASEMFINSGHILEKQKTTPKVIKITKTVAVKVPVVKYVPYLPEKEITTEPNQHQQYIYSTVAPYKEDRPDVLKYITPKPVSIPSPSSYQNLKFDSRPFYQRDPNNPKIMIKYIPMPVYETETTPQLQPTYNSHLEYETIPIQYQQIASTAETYPHHIQHIIHHPPPSKSTSPQEVYQPQMKHSYHFY